MADENTQATGATNTPAGEGTDQAAAAARPGQQPTPKGFVPITTQEEFDERIKARIARVKATPPADYDELRAKAARLDELEEANKSELERAQGKADKAARDAAEWKAKFEALQAEGERAAQVRAMADRYGVDADTLSRMAGDVEDNAKFLKAKSDAQPRFGTMTDGGAQPQAGMTLDEIRKIKDPVERVRARAEYISRHPQG